MLSENPTRVATSVDSLDDKQSYFVHPRHEDDP